MSSAEKAVLYLEHNVLEHSVFNEANPDSAEPETGVNWFGSATKEWNKT